MSIEWSQREPRIAQAFVGDFRLSVEKYDVGAKWRIWDTSQQLKRKNGAQYCSTMICEVQAESTSEARRQAEIVARSLQHLHYHEPRQQALFEHQHDDASDAQEADAAAGI